VRASRKAAICTACTSGGVGALLTLSALAVAAAHTANVVIPGAQATVEGNSSNCFPFGCVEEMRYQQVYDAAAFGLTEPHLITAIAFRNDQSGDAFTKNHPDVQINLSTTGAAVDGLDSTFANNVGADDTIVHNGALVLSSPLAPQVGPKPFDVVISLATPFLYDPAQGNLLLDVTVRDGDMDSLPVFLDAENTTGDEISRAYSFSAIASTSFVNNTDVWATWGLITQFTVEDATHTKADILIDSGVPGKGLETAPGLQKEFNPKSKAADNAGKK
jgi:hypothetical protein